jgi:ribosomal protein L9
MIRRTSASEIIDDSEPEREELRRKEKDERTKKKLFKPLVNNVDEEYKLFGLQTSAQKVSGT